MKDVGNLLQGLPDAAQGEVFEALVRTGDVLVERIVSQGQASPPGVWYEQSRAEWVLLLQGAARLEWENGEQVALQPGDYVLIAAGRRHRVAWTEPAGPEDVLQSGELLPVAAHVVVPGDGAAARQVTSRRPGV